MTKISVEIREEGGMFYATSEHMPGFLLCNATVADLRADILPAMKALVAIKEKYSKPAFIQLKVSQRIVDRVELGIAA